MSADEMIQNNKINKKCFPLQTNNFIFVPYKGKHIFTELFIFIAYTASSKEQDHAKDRNKYRYKL